MAFIKIVTRNVKFNSFLILNSAKIKNKMALKIAAKYIHTLIIYSYVHSTTLYTLDIWKVPYY